jgi:hypothetical protein
MPPEFQTALLERADAVLAELGPELAQQAEAVAHVVDWPNDFCDRSISPTVPWSQLPVGTKLYAAPQPQPLIHESARMTSKSQPQAVPEGWPAGRAARAMWDAATQPQASAEDLALVDGAVVKFWRDDYFDSDKAFDAWQRIRASLGVGE